VELYIQTSWVEKYVVQFCICSIPDDRGRKSESKPICEPLTGVTLKRNINKLASLNYNCKLQ